MTPAQRERAVARAKESVIGRARRIANEEIRRTRNVAPEGAGHNDSYDAERHARWSYRMAKEIGPVAAEAIYTQHELEGAYYGQPSVEFRMDMHNNAVGLSAALSGNPIPTREHPNLRTIDRKTGELLTY